MTLLNEPTATRSKLAPVAWALLVSALLNLFLVGVFLGVVPHVKHRQFGPMALAAPHGEYLVDWVSRYLDLRDADAFRESFKSQADALKHAHAHVHQAIGELSSVYQQDPPDAAALQTALDHLAKARDEVNDVIGKILQSSYTKLSPEGRHRLADLAQNPL
jgi:uncharacterized membrane protein